MIVVAVAALVFAGYAAVSAATRDDEPDYVSDYTYVAPEPRTPTIAAFLGDSYTEGTGVTGGVDGYAPATASRMCWAYEGFGQGGTGYTNPGQASEGESIYADRVADIIAATPNVVVVQGSTNDSDPAATYEQAVATYRALAAGLPGVPVLALGPTAPPAADPAVVAAVSASVARAATESGLRFFDPISEGWLPEDGYSSDRIHPNNAGHKALSTGFVGALRALDIPAADACAR